MDQIDQGLQQRVWQRVQGGDAGPSLQAMAVRERTAAAAYLMLSRQMQGRAKELLRQLYHRAQTHSRYLNGMNVLLEGRPLAVRTVPPEGSRPTVLLSRCYAEALKAAADYEHRAADSQMGAVFARMAREERENCAMLLEILGQPG